MDEHIPFYKQLMYRFFTFLGITLLYGVIIMFVTYNYGPYYMEALFRSVGIFLALFGMTWALYPFYKLVYMWAKNKNHNLITT